MQAAGPRQRIFISQYKYILNLFHYVGPDTTSHSGCHFSLKPAAFEPFAELSSKSVEPGELEAPTLTRSGLLVTVLLLETLLDFLVSILL